MKRFFIVFCLLLVIIAFGCQNKEAGTEPSPPAATKTNTPDWTATPTYTITETGTATFTRTFTPTPTNTASPTITPTPTVTQTATPSPTITATSTVCSYKFGYNDDVAGLQFSGEVLLASHYTLAETAVVNKIAIRLFAATNFSVGIYEDNGGVPGVKLGESGIESGAVGWNTVDIPQVTVYGGDTCWIVTITETSGGEARTDTGQTMQYLSYSWTDIELSGMPSNMPGWNPVSYLNEPKVYAIGCQ